MNIKQQTIFLFTCLSFIANSQGWRSRFKIQGSTENFSRAIFEMSSGNYFAAGFVSDTISNNTGDDFIVIMGLDQNGSLLWQKKYGRPNFQYLQNNFIRRAYYKQGNYVYHACCARDSTGKQYGALLKFDQSGDTVWQRIYRDPNMDVIPQMLTKSRDGGFLIKGFFQNWSNNTRPALLIKTDANGTELWRKVLNKSNPNVSDGKAILQDSTTGKIVIPGYRCLIPNTLSILDNIVILDSLGNNPIVKSYSGFDGGYLYDMIQCSDTTIVASGFEFTAETAGGSNLTKAFIVKFKLNNPANPIWRTYIDQACLNNDASCLLSGANGDIIVGGQIDTLQIDNIPPNAQVRLVVFDKNGAIKSKKYYDYRLPKDTVWNQLELVSLNFSSNNSLIAAVRVVNVQEPNDLLFVKYDATGCDNTITYCDSLASVGIQPQTKNQILMLYPNPASSDFSLVIKDVSDRLLRFSIVDVTGKIILNGILKPGETKVNIDPLVNGIYFISVKDENTLLYKQKFAVAKN